MATVVWCVIYTLLVQVPVDLWLIPVSDTVLRDILTPGLQKIGVYTPADPSTYPVTEIL